MYKIFLFISCFSLVGWGQIQLESLQIVSAITSETHLRTGNHIYDFNDQVRLGIVVCARIPPLHSITYLTPFKHVIIDGDTLAPERCERWERFSQEQPLIRWSLILPTKVDSIYYNSGRVLAPWANITYSEIALSAWDNKWQVVLADLPSRQVYLPGTIWLKVALAFKGQYVSTPGIESKYRLPDGHYYGGLSEAVQRLSIRGDTGNPFVDNLIALHNLPFIENANSWNGFWTDHQTKKWLGGNRSSFYQLAAEMGGRSLLLFFNQLPLPALNYYQLTTNYGRLATLAEDHYVLDGGSEIILSKNTFTVGDFILKAGQEGVLYRDRSSHGYVPNFHLDGNDWILYWNKGEMLIAPLAQAFGDSLVLIKWVQRW